MQYCFILTERGQYNLPEEILRNIMVLNTSTTRPANAICIVLTRPGDFEVEWVEWAVCGDDDDDEEGCGREEKTEDEMRRMGSMRQPREGLICVAAKSLSKC
ncbi:hypothetical protein BJ165DRAFT_1409763 [Panaeolus papilionaceus]|nr:hypothetical protein BJ165DRAFT_1409763 [Panaeolus papilionaceus]